jgi:superfamily II DNA or RNA helicase
MENYYLDYYNSDFSKVLNKYEFKEQSKRKSVYAEPRQLLLRNLISKNTIYDNILLFHATGAGKCMKIDTEIIMYDGTINKIQDIKINDLIMGDDSTPRRVLSLARGRDIMYEIKNEKQESYTVNSEHILSLQFSGKPTITNKYNQVKWFDINSINVKSKNFKNEKDAYIFLQEKNDDYKKHLNRIDIPIKDFLKLNKTLKKTLKGYKVSLDFEHKDLDFDPYMIGFWLGDGSHDGTRISNQDATVIKYFKENLPKYKCYLQYKDNYDYIINGDGSNKPGCNYFLNILRKHNLIRNKHIPMIYKCNSRENRLKLLAGLLDADGSLDKNKTGYEFSQSLEHEQIIDDIIYLCRSLGFACYKNKKQTSWTHKGIKKHGEAWRICISGKGIENIPVLCPRKKANSRRQIKDVLVSGIKVEELPEDNYYGFELDGNHRYVLGDFTITHNTASSILIAEGFKEYILNMDRKIVVLIKNGNIEENFRSELLSGITQNEYIQHEGREYLKTASVNAKKDYMNKINRKLNKIYDFMTYGTFINQVLGAKVYEKDSKKKRKDDEGLDIRKSVQNFTLSNSVIIIDEAHNITNNNFYIALKQVLNKSYNYRLVLLTATPIYDNPKEIFELSNLLNMDTQDKLYPVRNELFKPLDNSNLSIMKKISSETRILKSELNQITDYGKELLISSLKGKISYLPINKKSFPEKIDMGDPLTKKKGTMNVIYCQMSDYQYNVYITALNLDTLEPNDIDVDNIDENFIPKSSSLYKNSSDASTMSYPNNKFGKDGFNLCFKEIKGIIKNTEFPKLLKEDLQKYSTKLYNLLLNIKSSPGNIFIYSNYVNLGGTALIRHLLLANGYNEYKGSGGNSKSFVLYNEAYTQKEREHLRSVFNNANNNNGKYIKIIIGSPLISEGITLKNIRQIHILEPAWNMSTLNQIIGRGIRNYSHESLPIEDRNVQIYKYCAFYTNQNTNYIDKEKYILSEEKDRLNKDIERLLKRLSFDCTLNPQDNNTDLIGTADCDYTDCNYECFIKSNDNYIDKFTYNLYINFFDEFDINLNITLIKEKFKNFFVWELNDIIKSIKDYEPIVSNESIFMALKQLIDNKTIITDQYERNGFIIQKGNYFIFNPIGIDINSSIYSKMLDFTVPSNEYTLNEYTKMKNISLEQKLVKKTSKNINIELSDEIIDYNNNIIDNNDIKIYGSYRKRAKKDGPEFGPIDNIFKIIDLRDINDTIDDARKTKSGMAITSYQKQALQDICNYLEISTKTIQEYLGFKNVNIDQLKKEQLIFIITKRLDIKREILH